MSTPSSPPLIPTPAAVSPAPRQPLGLPEGSVRALLALMVFGTIWALLLIHEDKPEPVPLYLYYLMFLILGSYFAARRHRRSSHVRRAAIDLNQSDSAALLLLLFIPFPRKVAP